MTQLTDQKWLVENFDIQVMQYGPQPGWPVGETIYLQCAHCKYYVCTTDYDECTCGCISIDVGYARVSVSDRREADVAVCRVTRKTNP